MNVFNAHLGGEVLNRLGGSEVRVIATGQLGHLMGTTSEGVTVILDGRVTTYALAELELLGAAPTTPAPAPVRPPSALRMVGSVPSVPRSHTWPLGGE